MKSCIATFSVCLVSPIAFLVPVWTLFRDESEGSAVVVDLTMLQPEDPQVGATMRKLKVAICFSPNIMTSYNFYLVCLFICQLQLAGQNYF